MQNVSTPEPTVTAVIVTFNSHSQILQCIESLAHEGCEIVIVDNASSDATASVVSEHCPGVTLMTNPRNTGFSAACNQGAHSVETPYVLFVNPDTVVEPGAVRAMVAFLTANTDYVAVGPLTVDGMDKVNRSCARRTISIWWQACQLLHLDRMFPRSRLFAGGFYQPWDYAEERDVECLSGAAICCRKAILDRIGGFDESVPLYLDDIDLCRRMHRLGRMRVLTGARVKHAHNQSGKSMPDGFLEELSLQARFTYFKKHDGILAAGAFSALVFASGILAGFCAVGLSLCGNTSLAKVAGRRSTANLRWLVRKERSFVLPECSEALENGPEAPEVIRAN